MQEPQEEPVHAVEDIYLQKSSPFFALDIERNSNCENYKGFSHLADALSLQAECIFVYRNL